MKKLIIVLALLLAVPAWGVKLIPNGSTSQSISVVIVDSSGDPNASVTITDLDLYCQKDGAGAQSAKLDVTALATADTAWTTGKAVHKGNGVYRIDIPDANLSDGAGSLLTYIIDDASTSNDTVYYEVQLVDAAYFTGLTTLTGRVIETINLSGLTDNIQAAMDANSTKLGYLIETINLSDLIDNIQAAIDANGLQQYYTQAKAGYLSNINNVGLLELNLSDIGDKVWADEPNAASIAAILADTAELQTDWTDGGRLDVILDAITGYVTGSVGRYASLYGLPSLAFLPSALLILYYRRRKHNENSIG